MRTIKYLIAVISAVFVFASCQKEYSAENGNTGGVAAGTLLDAMGNCQPITVNGTYQTDSILTDSNYILVQANVTTPGIYTISTDLQNGMSFKDSGYIGATGVQTFKLKGSGQPVSATPTEFAVMFGTSFCLFSITPTVGTGGGGGNTATYSLIFSAGNCSNYNVQGTYTTGTPLSSSNTVTLQVDVYTVGPWAVSTGTQNGMTFSGSGTFNSAGSQVITLTGTGTPTTSGANSINVTAGSSACAFNVNVVPGNGGGTMTGDYFPTTANSNWTYKEDSNTDTLRVTATSTTATKAGNTYLVFSSSPDTASLYYRKGGGSYHQYGTTDELGMYDTVLTQVDFIFLKDNVATNSTWESPEVSIEMGGFPGKAKIKFTIVGKDISYTVNGRVLDSVIKVKREYMMQLTGTPYQTIGSADFYYAKNIGFVEASSTAFASKIYATRWDVK